MRLAHLPIVLVLQSSHYRPLAQFDSVLACNRHQAEGVQLLSAIPDTWTWPEPGPCPAELYPLWCCLPESHSLCQGLLAGWQELEDRAKFLDALSEKYSVAGWPEPGPLPEQPPLPKDEAILLIQANERGRQARDRAQAMYTFKRQRQLEDRRARSGIVSLTSWLPSVHCAASSLPTSSQRWLQRE